MWVPQDAARVPQGPFESQTLRGVRLARRARLAFVLELPSHLNASMAIKTPSSGWRNRQTR